MNTNPVIPIIRFSKDDAVTKITKHLIWREKDPLPELRKQTD